VKTATKPQRTNQQKAKWSRQVLQIGLKVLKKASRAKGADDDATENVAA